MSTTVEQRMTYLDYNSISMRLDSFTDIVRNNFDALVIILRGAAFAGFHLSFNTGLPYYLLRYDRETSTASWVGTRPAGGSRLLICEDVAGNGRTLKDSQTFVEQCGYEVSTLVVFKDDLSATSPDYFCYDFQNTDTRVVLPWERYRVNVIANGIVHDGRADHEYNKTGWDMDGVFLRDVDSEHWRRDHEAALALRDTLSPAEFAPSPSGTDVIITGRPTIDKDRTEKWLDEQNFYIPVYFRDDEITHPTAESTARFKGAKAIELGCTHYVESDARQAAFIASFYPQIQVLWWNEGNPIMIGASLVR